MSRTAAALVGSALLAGLGIVGVVSLREQGGATQIGLVPSADPRLAAYHAKAMEHMKGSGDAIQLAAGVQLYMAASGTSSADRETVSDNLGKLLDDVNTKGQEELSEFADVVSAFGVQQGDWRVLFLGTHEGKINLGVAEAHLQEMAFGICYQGPAIDGARFDLELRDAFGDVAATLPGREVGSVGSGFCETWIIVKGVSEDEPNAPGIGGNPEDVDGQGRVY